MREKWSFQQTLDLIKIYEKNEALYKCTHKDNANSLKRKYSIAETAKELADSRPGVTSEEVRNKIASLGRKLKEELRRKDEFIRDGRADEYKPKYWCFEYLGFLVEAIEEKAKLKKQQQQTSGGSTEMTQEDDSASVSPNPLQDNHRVVNEATYSNDGSEEITYCTRPKRYKNNCIEGSDCFGKLPDDEFHYFGLNVASQLRDMPLGDALEVQEDITNLLVNKRLELL